MLIFFKYSCFNFIDHSLKEKDDITSSQSTVIPSQPSTGSNFSIKGGRDYVSKNLVGKIDVMTERVVAAIDKCRITFRMAVHLISAIALALGIDPKDLILNKSSFHVRIKSVRKKLAENIKELYGEKSITSAIIHWDGKIIPDSFSGKNIDRLPILATVGKDEQLIDVAALENGKGITQANAVYDALTDWGLRESIKALCCDTTNSNLGHINGAATLLEQFLGRDLLYLPCRHHIYEIILAAAFDSKIPGTSGPNVPLFKRFRDNWNNIDQSKFKNGLHLNNIDEILMNKIPGITAFIKKSLNSKWPRDDYRELLELSLIFLGGIPTKDVKFRKVGAIHHARFMAKAIYSLKIYMFREVFKLTNTEKKALFDLCLFIVFVYIESWFKVPLAIKAPNQDLNFIKKLFEYKKSRFAISHSLFAENEKSWMVFNCRS